MLSEKLALSAILLTLPYFGGLLLSVAIHNEARRFINDQKNIVIPGRVLIDDILANVLYLGVVSKEKSQPSVEAIESQILSNLDIYKKEFAFSSQANREFIKSTAMLKLADEERLQLNDLEKAIKFYISTPSLTALNDVKTKSNNLQALLRRANEVRTKEFEAITRPPTLALFAIWIMTVLGNGLLILYFYRKIIKPIEALSAISVDIAAGKSRLIPYRKEKNEIGKLYDSVRKMDENLTRNIHQLDESSRLKTEFVSIASHQLRTPLSSIKWLIEMLLESDKDLTSLQKERLQDIYTSNQRSIVLIGDLLNVAKLEGGEMVAQKRPTNIEDVIKGEIDLIKSATESKKLKINLKKETEIGSVQLDPTLFLQAFRNLLDNAVAYSPNDSTIDITLTRNEKNYIIAVHNEGAAIVEFEHDKLFTKFYRGPVAQRLRPEGSGLGLFIAKMAVESNGGNIWFESPTHDESGVTFYISVPIS